MHEYGGNLGAANQGPLSGSPVRESVTGDVHTGPVSEVSAGAVTSSAPVSGGGAVTDSSAGSVQKDVTSPLRAPAAQPVEDLTRLQEQLRGIQPVPRMTPLPGEAAAEEEAARAAAEAANTPEATPPAEGAEEAEATPAVAPEAEEAVAPQESGETAPPPPPEEAEAAPEPESAEAEPPAPEEPQAEEAPTPEPTRQP